MLGGQVKLFIDRFEIKVIWLHIHISRIGFSWFSGSTTPKHRHLG